MARNLPIKNSVLIIRQFICETVVDGYLNLIKDYKDLIESMDCNDDSVSFSKYKDILFDIAIISENLELDLEQIFTSELIEGDEEFKEEMAEDDIYVEYEEGYEIIAEWAKYVRSPSVVDKATIIGGLSVLLWRIKDWTSHLCNIDVALNSLIEDKVTDRRGIMKIEFNEN